jgi:hypothetical protein
MVEGFERRVGWTGKRGTNLLACVGWLIGGVRVLVFLFAFDKPTGLPSGPFSLLLVDADISTSARDMRRAPRSLLTNNWL